MKTKLFALLAVASVAAVFTFSNVVPKAQAGQPNMQNALASLRNARASLQVAEQDKGGHRVQALNLVNQAIEQVRLGIAAGR